MSSLSSQADVMMLTTAGRRRLESRLARLNDELTELGARIKAGGAGADDVLARHHLEEQVDELRRVLEGAADVAAVEEDPSIVEVGDEVDVVDVDGGVDTYAVVHAAEADAHQNRISTQSPLGRALLGARPGDRVTVLAPAGPYTCVVRARRRLA